MRARGILPGRICDTGLLKFLCAVLRRECKEICEMLEACASNFLPAFHLLTRDIENTWAHGDMKFIFECSVRSATSGVATYARSS